MNSDRGIGNSAGMVLVHADGRENAHDHAVWRAKWTLDIFNDVDKDEILVPDIETDKVLRSILLEKRESAVDELRFILFNRAQSQALNLEARQTAFKQFRRLDGLNAKDVGRKFKTKADETREHVGNLLMYGGVSCLWEFALANGTATAGQTLTYFTNAQAAVGVGDSSTAAAATQTDLQAATNKLRVAMNSTYPQHTDGVTSSNNTITFQSTFGNSQANYAWNEIAAFNSSTAATGRMLNRLVQSFGTKSSGSWSMSLQISIS